MVRSLLAVPLALTFGLAGAAFAAEVETSQTYRSESYRVEAPPPPPVTHKSTVEKRTEVQGSSGNYEQRTYQERTVQQPRPQTETTVQRRSETVTSDDD
ncbi:MAG TPA: hypothetical protein VFD92_16815 [Candidatus Binatia bacterium]|nr:hypothetical protein [Candidatus Binatia bacterium]